MCLYASADHPDQTGISDYAYYTNVDFCRNIFQWGGMLSFYPIFIIIYLFLLGSGNAPSYGQGSTDTECAQTVYLTNTQFYGNRGNLWR